ncbi:hypothetical protein PIB30_082234 [Stylosanthes scabra]|uniref:SCP domain-containing protein n=1 Tax=Stylosanthes scabra TaxID=79078 RepID=A0ABU6YS84_9FABA|nr:hypothetical protein [Stylosanthes scabra]
MRTNAVIICFVSVLYLVLCILGHHHDAPKDYLKGHNHARASVGVQPLKWNQPLQGVAQRFLNKHVEDCLEGQLSAVASRYYGQNNAHNLVSEITVAEAVASWVEQKQYYDYHTNSCNGADCRCYTQVVWRNSTHIGCDRVRCRNGGTLVTCIYRPRGNLVDQRPY